MLLMLLFDGQIGANVTTKTEKWVGVHRFTGNNRNVVIALYYFNVNKE